MMISEDKFTVVDDMLDDVARDALRDFSPEVIGRLGLRAKEFFSELGDDFPLLVNAIAEGFSDPKIALRRTRFGDHIAAVFLAGKAEKDRLIFGQLWHSETLSLSSPRLHSDWLPKPLRSWYAITDGLQWGRWQTGLALKSKDFPTQYAGRFSVEGYCESQGLKRGAAKMLYKRIGSDSVRGWIYTEEPQAIFIDEASKDGLIYHVRGVDFDDLVVLKSPEYVLDRYFATLIARGPTPDFDFRAPVV